MGYFFNRLFSGNFFFFLMGVGGFFGWIFKRYPLIAKSLSECVLPSIDCFFVDFNCIIHNASRTIDGSKDLDQSELISEILRFLDTLVRVVSPKVLLFIAVDGSAPLAKCLQQRDRRFGGKAHKSGFEKNSISIGTEFMERMHRVLLEFIQEKKRHDDSWKTPSVIYSSYHTPGEGEHKIFDFIRNQRQASLWNEDAYCCVYSPDSDLVFICLQNRIKNMCILKDNDMIFKSKNDGKSLILNDSGFRFSRLDFAVVFVGIVREYLVMDILNGDFNQIDRMIDDFCWISFFLGNDFIPTFSDFSIREGGFNNAINIYVDQFVSKHMFLVENDHLHKSNFAQYLRMIINNSNMDRDFSERAFEKKFGSCSVEKQREIAFNILDGFHWVLRYYRYGCQSWTWGYFHDSAPPLSIVIKYMDEYEVNFDKSYPSEPQFQLLCTLPHLSYNLLPVCLRELTNPESSFKAVFHGKARDITKSDIESLRSVYNGLKESFSEEEKMRNIFEKSFLITQSEIIPIDYDHVFNLNGIQNGLIMNYYPSFFAIPVKVIVSDRKKLIVLEERLTLKTVADNQSLSIKFLQGLIGKKILSGYPFMKPSIVDNVIHKSELSENVLQTLRKEYYSNGLDISSADVFIKVRKIAYSNHNFTLFEYENNCQLIPYELTCPISFLPVLSCLLKPTDIQLYTSMPVYVISSKSIGYIESYSANNVSVCITKNCKSNSFNHTFIDDKSQWMTMTQFSLNCGIPESAILFILGSISSPRYSKNVGFRMIKGFKGSCGWIKKDRSLYYVNPSLVPIMNEYKEKSGLLINFFIENHSNPAFPECYTSFINNMGSEGESLVETLSSWVNEHSPKKFSHHISFASSSFLPNTISKLEKLLMKEEPKPIESHITTTFDNIVFPGQIMPPQLFNSGDKVVYVSTSGVASFGSTGIVINGSCRRSLITIAAEYPIKHGLTMNDNFSQRRVFIAQANNLINISK